MLVLCQSYAGVDESCVGNSTVARKVWEYFEGKPGISNNNTNVLKIKLNEWWWLYMVRSPCFKEVVSFVSVAICWELQVSREIGGVFKRDEMCK